MLCTAINVSRKELAKCCIEQFLQFVASSFYPSSVNNLENIVLFLMPHIAWHLQFGKDFEKLAPVIEIFQFKNCVPEQWMLWRICLGRFNVYSDIFSESTKTVFSKKQTRWKYVFVEYSNFLLKRVTRTDAWKSRCMRCASHFKMHQLKPSIYRSQYTDSDNSSFVMGHTQWVKRNILWNFRLVVQNHFFLLRSDEFWNHFRAKPYVRLIPKNLPHESYDTTLPSIQWNSSNTRTSFAYNYCNEHATALNGMRMWVHFWWYFDEFSLFRGDSS